MKTFFLRGVIPALSLSVILNLAIRAETGQSSSAQSQPTPTEVVLQTAVQDGKTSVNTATELPEPPAFQFPIVGPLYPKIEFAIVPHSAKLEEELDFEEPEVKSLSAPRSFKATAYSLRGRTASGVTTQPGVVAADPKVLPLGSVIEIKAGSYSGVYTVHDTGSAVKGNLVDVWMPSSREARQFGRRSIKLQVLRYGPATRTKKSK